MSIGPVTGSQTTISTIACGSCPKSQNHAQTKVQIPHLLMFRGFLHVRVHRWSPYVLLTTSVHASPNCAVLCCCLCASTSATTTRPHVPPQQPPADVRRRPGQMLIQGQRCTSTCRHTTCCANRASATVWGQYTIPMAHLCQLSKAALSTYSTSPANAVTILTSPVFTFVSACDDHTLAFWLWAECSKNSSCVSPSSSLISTSVRVDQFGVRWSGESGKRAPRVRNPDAASRKYCEIAAWRLERFRGPTGPRFTGTAWHLEELRARPALNPKP